MTRPVIRHLFLEQNRYLHQNKANFNRHFLCIILAKLLSHFASPQICRTHAHCMLRPCIVDFACTSQLANCIRTSASHVLFVINNIHNCLLIIDYCTFCQKQSDSRFVISKLVVGLCEQAHTI